LQDLAVELLGQRIKLMVRMVCKNLLLSAEQTFNAVGQRFEFFFGNPIKAAKGEDHPLAGFALWAAIGLHKPAIGIALDGAGIDFYRPCA